ENWLDRYEATRAASSQADLLIEKSRVPEALEKFEQVLNIRRELATQHGESPVLQFALSETLEMICYFRRKLRRLDAALEACTEALRINEGLAAQDRTSAVRMGRNARIQIRMAEVEEDRQNFDLALTLYKDALTISERLATLDPLNADRQYEAASALIA